MSLIKVSNLTFAYDGSYSNIFENASFHIDTDWKLGFVGRNGRGKTTFLNLLLGKYQYSGSISASVDFDYFPFAVGLDENAIDIAAAIDPGYELWRLNREMNMLNLTDDILYRPFNTLSNGERTKFLLAALFAKENNFLLIDEPTNHLDSPARRLTASYLNSKKGFILVSHDREFLDSCIDHVLSINKTNIEVTRGNFSQWHENKEQRDNFEIEENKKLSKEIKKLEASAKQAARWSDKVEKTKFGTLNSGVKPDKGRIGHKAAKMMKRSKNIESRRNTAASEKSALLKNIENSEKLALKPLAHHAQRLAELKDISLFYGDKMACTGISFAIEKGDIISLRGRNGSGKSSILRLIAGESLSYTGEIYRAGGLIISTVPQDTAGLMGDFKSFSKDNSLEESLFKAILRKLDFPRDEFDKKLEELSQGQKKKVLIAKSLCQKAHLYIWDEPLNYIDIISRMQIEDLLTEHSLTMIFVEHDEAFSKSIANKFVYLP